MSFTGQGLGTEVCQLHLCPALSERALGPCWLAILSLCLPAQLGHSPCLLWCPGQEGIPRAFHPWVKHLDPGPSPQGWHCPARPSTCPYPGPNPQGWYLPTQPVHVPIPWAESPRLALASSARPRAQCCFHSGQPAPESQLGVPVSRSCPDPSAGCQTPH